MSTDRRQGAGATGSTILVVDDERNIRLTISEALRDEGYPIVSASSGDEALRVLHEKQVSLVLLDLRLGDVNGLHVLKRARDAGCNASFVIITAHGSVSTAVEAMKYGAAEYLQKPFAQDELRETVRAVLSRRAKANRNGPSYDDLIERAVRAIRTASNAEASRYLDQALALESNRPEVHNLKGVIHEKEGDRFEAQQCYRMALEIDATYQPARVNLHESVEPSGDGSFLLQETKK